MNLLIRKMNEEDIEAVTALEAASFTSPWSKDAFISSLKDSNYRFYVAYDGDIHIGTVGFTLTKPEADISNVCVSTSYRRQGIAYKLLAYGMEDTSKEGITDFTLEVREGNKSAIGLYEKLGFESAGIRKNFYSNPVENALIMWKK